MPKKAESIFFEQVKTIESSLEDLKVIDIPVCYGGAFGPDLDHCAKTLSVPSEEIITLHTAEPFLVQMMGVCSWFCLLW